MGGVLRILNTVHPNYKPQHKPICLLNPKVSLPILSKTQIHLTCTHVVSAMLLSISNFKVPA